MTIAIIGIITEQTIGKLVVVCQMGGMPICNNIQAKEQLAYIPKRSERSGSNTKQVQGTKVCFHTFHFFLWDCHKYLC